MLQFRPPLVQLPNKAIETGFKSTAQYAFLFLIDVTVLNHPEASAECSVTF